MMATHRTPRYTDLPSTATQILTALTALDLSEVDLPELAAVLAIDESTLLGTLALLRQAGWLETTDETDHRWRLVDTARRWLNDQGTSPTVETIPLVERYLEHHIGHLDPARNDMAQRRAWVDDHSEGIVQAIRAAARAGLSANAAH